MSMATKPGHLTTTGYVFSMSGCEGQASIRRQDRVMLVGERRQAAVRVDWILPVRAENVDRRKHGNRRDVRVRLLCEHSAGEDTQHAERCRDDKPAARPNCILHVRGSLLRR
jgi:hypothetical protein